MKIDLSKWEKKTSPPHPDDDEHLIVGYYNSLGNAVLEHFTQYNKGNCWELSMSIGERLYIESGGCTPEDARDAAVRKIKRLAEAIPLILKQMEEW